MPYINDKNFSSVFGDAADGIEFDSVLEADEENELIEQVLSLSNEEDDIATTEASDDDFHETTGENDKTAKDIEEELEGRPDDGDNTHTNTFDIDMSDEAAIEAALMEAESGLDLAETTGENNKSPEDLKRELEGRPDDACNKHTGTFDPEKGSDLSMGNYNSVNHDLDNLEDAAGKAADKGENLYTAGKLSTEAAEDEPDNGIEDGEDPDPDYYMDDFEGTDDYDGNDDFEGTEDYDGQEDYDGVAEGADDYDDFEDVEDYNGVEEAANDDSDEDDDLIDAADEDDGQMTQAEVEALVAVGGDDELLDGM